MTPSRAPATAADYNLRILWPLARWVEEHRGADALASILQDLGVDVAQFEERSTWVSDEVFETILSRARSLMPDDATFMTACTHRIREAYGPLRYVLWATSPAAVYTQSIQSFHLVSAVTKLSIVSQTATHMHYRVDPAGRTISRLTCLVRQAQARELPTLWGLPAAFVREEACIGRGDATCEIHLRWYATRSILPILAGAFLMGGVGAVLAHFGLATVPTPVFLAMLGALGGYVIEGRRAERVNQATREEIIGALRQLAREEAEARREVLALHQRQREWTRLVEEQVGERTAMLQHVVEGMRGLQEERVSRVLGFSHDLRNPLQVLQYASEVLHEHVDAGGDDDMRELVTDMDQSIAQMKRMLGDLVKVASGQRAIVQLAPERVEVTELTERLLRRLKALVHGRDIRATVFATREAPDAIDIDPLLLDRVVDNLLTNAAKYTERGSIIVECDGTPGFLVLKVSDTGRGMEADQLERSFAVGGSDPSGRARDSFGVGLSVVVQLLDQIGGRLEVMSRPAEGTTFWVYLPLVIVAASQAKGAETQEKEGHVLSRVVRIRRLTA
jgi:signal transduction histidine kinase